MSNLDISLTDTPFVGEMAAAIDMPCYVTRQDALVSALAMTQFNYLSVFGAVVGQTTAHQVRSIRAHREAYMADEPVDKLCAFFEHVVLQVRV